MVLNPIRKIGVKSSQLKQLPPVSLQAVPQDGGTSQAGGSAATQRDKNKPSNTDNEENLSNLMQDAKITEKDENKEEGAKEAQAEAEKEKEEEFFEADENKDNDNKEESKPAKVAEQIKRSAKKKGKKEKK